MLRRVCIYPTRIKDVIVHISKHHPIPAALKSTVPNGIGGIHQLSDHKLCSWRETFVWYRVSLFHLMVIVFWVSLSFLKLLVFIHLRSICKTALWTILIYPNSNHVFSKVGNPFEMDITTIKNLQNWVQLLFRSHRWRRKRRKKGVTGCLFRILL